MIRVERVSRVGEAHPVEAPTADSPERCASCGGRVDSGGCEHCAPTLRVARMDDAPAIIPRKGIYEVCDHGVVRARCLEGCA